MTPRGGCRVPCRAARRGLRRTRAGTPTPPTRRAPSGRGQRARAQPRRPGPRPRGMEAEHRVLRELDVQLSSRRREHLRVALERPAADVTEALGARPDQPRARAPGSRPPRASRPTASTTPSPMPVTRMDPRRATSRRVRAGNAPTVTFNTLSDASVTRSTAGTRTRSSSVFRRRSAAAWFSYDEVSAGADGHSSRWGDARAPRGHECVCSRLIERNRYGCRTLRYPPS